MKDNIKYGVTLYLFGYVCCVETTKLLPSALEPFKVYISLLLLFDS